MASLLICLFKFKYLNALLANRTTCVNSQFMMFMLTDQGLKTNENPEPPVQTPFPHPAANAKLAKKRQFLQAVNAINKNPTSSHQKRLTVKSGSKKNHHLLFRFSHCSSCTLTATQEAAWTLWRAIIQSHRCKVGSTLSKRQLAMLNV